MSETTISDEAREAAKSIRDTAYTSVTTTEFLENSLPEIIQLAIGIATEKLTEENRKLKEENETWHEASKAWSEVAKQKETLQKQVHGLSRALSRAQDHCPNCKGTGRDHDGERWLDISCPDCQFIFDALSSTPDFSKQALNPKKEGAT